MTERYEFPSVYRMGKTTYIPLDDNTYRVTGMNRSAVTGRYTKPDGTSLDQDEADNVNMRSQEACIFLMSVVDLLRSNGYTVIEPPTDSI